MRLLHALLFFFCVEISRVNAACSLCIVDSACADDSTSFNLSVTCDETPLPIYYYYYTDVSSERRYTNETITCPEVECYHEIDVDLERDAWDYTLIIESPKFPSLCSVRTAHCGGATSLLLWYIVGGLSGLFTLLGAVSCLARYYRTRHRSPGRERTLHDSIINS